MTVHGDPIPTFDTDFDQLLACDRLHTGLQEAADRLDLFVPDIQEFNFEGVSAGRYGNARLEGTLTQSGDTITNSYLRFSGLNPDADSRQFRIIRGNGEKLWRVGDEKRDNPGVIKLMRRNLGIDKIDSDAWLTGVDLNAQLKDEELFQLVGQLGIVHGSSHELTRIFKPHKQRPSAGKHQKKNRGATISTIHSTEHPDRYVVAQLDVPFELAGGIVPLHVTVGSLTGGTIETSMWAMTPAGKRMDYDDINDYPELADVILERVDELIENKTVAMLEQ